MRFLGPFLKKDQKTLVFFLRALPLKIIGSFPVPPFQNTEFYVCFTCYYG